MLEVLISMSALDTLTEYAQNIDLSDISSKLLCTIIEIFNQNKHYDFVAELKKRDLLEFHKNARILYYVGSALAKIGKLSESLSILLEALRLDEANILILKFIGLTYKELNNYEKALEYLTAADKKNPLDVDTKISIGNTHQKFGALNLARIFFNEALQIDPENKVAQNSLGVNYMEDNELKAAQRIFNELIFKFPNFHEAKLNLGNIYKKQGRHLSAIKIYKSLLPKIFEPDKVCHNIAISFLELGDIENAKSFLIKAISYNPINTSAHRSLSRLINYRKQNDHTNEIQRLQEYSRFTIDQKIDLYMVQHKIYHDNFDYENSFKFLKEANNLKKHSLGYNIQKDRYLFELINNNFNYSYSSPIATKKKLAIK